MSKMSQLSARLDEEAAELGYESVEAMEADGWHVSYEEVDGDFEITLRKKETREDPKVPIDYAKFYQELRDVAEGEEEKAHVSELFERNKNISTLRMIARSMVKFADIIDEISDLADNLIEQAEILKAIADYVEREIK